MDVTDPKTKIRIQYTSVETGMKTCKSCDGDAYRILYGYTGAQWKRLGFICDTCRKKLTTIRNSARKTKIYGFPVGDKGVNLIGLDGPSAGTILRQCNKKHPQVAFSCAGRAIYS